MRMYLLNKTKNCFLNHIKRIPRTSKVGRCITSINSKIRYTLDYKFHALLKKVLLTKPLYSNPSADVEVHSLGCAADLLMYILSIKSLLRFHDNICVVVHDDGSLKNKHIEILRAHIEGIKIIEKRFADRMINQNLSKYPYSRYFRSARVLMLHVLDFSMLAEKKDCYLRQRYTFS